MDVEYHLYSDHNKKFLVVTKGTKKKQGWYEKLLHMNIVQDQLPSILQLNLGSTYTTNEKRNETETI